MAKRNRKPESVAQPAPKVTYLAAQPFAGGTYRMELGPDQIMEIETGMSRSSDHMVTMQRYFGVKPMPIFELFSHIMSGRVEQGEGSIGNPFRSGASMALISNVVRLALIGGGECSPADARQLVADNAPPHCPLQELWNIAAAVMYATLVGIDESGNG